MAISLKKQREIRNAISAEAEKLISEYAPEVDDGTPEMWSKETTKMFDLITDFERKVDAAVTEILIK